MLWEKEYSYKIIEDVSIQFLEEFCEKNNIYLYIKFNNATMWAAFSNYYGRKMGLKPFEAASFSYMISSGIAEMGISSYADAYFDEERVFIKSLEIYNKIQKKDIPEIDKVKEFFQKVLDLYLDPDFSEEYELKNNVVNVRMGISDLTKVDLIEGKNRSDKVRRAIHNYKL